MLLPQQMNIRILEGSIHRIDLHTRMPFKYGIATMTHMPQVFVRLVCEVDGQSCEGVSSDLLPPKWFTKIPEKDPQLEIEEMLLAIRNALSLATGMQGDSAFNLWLELKDAQGRWATEQNLPPLLAHFGTSLVERALIDGVCRATGKSFATALHENVLGVRLGDIHAELMGKEPRDLLPAQPLASVIARHTVGLADPLTDADISSGDRLQDGLPQSLEDCIRTYGLRHFKLKVNGQPASDLARLQQIAAILEAHAPADYAFSLDGNEQFKSIEAFRAFWESLQDEPSLTAFLKHLYFVEQPLHRDFALSDAAGSALKDWPNGPPTIIDESDSDLTSLPRALSLGYAGTSHKNCKGVFKGIANRCLLLHRTLTQPERPWLMSGEDLCNQGPIALLQDLAVMGALGIESVERNGHHYVAGLSAYAEEVQRQVLEAHPDLYHATTKSWPSLTIESGRISLRSINQAPFGNGFVLPCSGFTDVTRS
jgi:hypothetical protein